MIYVEPALWSVPFPVLASAVFFVCAVVGALWSVALHSAITPALRDCPACGYPMRARCYNCIAEAEEMPA